VITGKRGKIGCSNISLYTGFRMVSMTLNDLERHNDRRRALTELFLPFIVYFVYDSYRPTNNNMKSGDHPVGTAEILGPCPIPGANVIGS